MSHAALARGYVGRSWGLGDGDRRVVLVCTNDTANSDRAAALQDGDMVCGGVDLLHQHNHGLR